MKLTLALFLAAASLLAGQTADSETKAVQTYQQTVDELCSIAPAGSCYLMRGGHFFALVSLKELRAMTKGKRSFFQQKHEADAAIRKPVPPATNDKIATGTVEFDHSLIHIPPCDSPEAKNASLCLSKDPAPVTYTLPKECPNGLQSCEWLVAEFAEQQKINAELRAEIAKLQARLAELEKRK
jgi:hypothetical protein